MASNVKQIKQEPDSKTEARVKLSEALEAVDASAEQNMMSADEGEEEMLDEEMEEHLEEQKNVNTNEEEDQDAQMEEEEEEYVPVKKERAERPTIINKQKPLPQASYIMKLFDRSVNLAKFDEDTPLYPLCRAWMKNQPRAQIIKTEKSPDEQPIVQTVEDGDVVEMPKIRIRKGKQVITKPENKLNIKDFDKLIDTEAWTKEKLLEFHREKWTEEKSKYIETSRTFEEKHFAANLQLLDSLRKYEEED